MIEQICEKTDPDRKICVHFVSFPETGAEPLARALLDVAHSDIGFPPMCEVWVIWEQEISVACPDEGRSRKKVRFSTSVVIERDDSWTEILGSLVPVGNEAHLGTVLWKVWFNGHDARDARRILVASLNRICVENPRDEEGGDDG